MKHRHVRHRHRTNARTAVTSLSSVLIYPDIGSLGREIDRHHHRTVVAGHRLAAHRGIDDTQATRRTAHDSHIVETLGRRIGRPRGTRRVAQYLEVGLHRRHKRVAGARIPVTRHEERLLPPRGGRGYQPRRSKAVARVERQMGAREDIVTELHHQQAARLLAARQRDDTHRQRRLAAQDAYPIAAPVESYRTRPSGLHPRRRRQTRQQVTPTAAARHAVELLQRHDIWVIVRDDRSDTPIVSHTVGADGIAHVVGHQPHLGRARIEITEKHRRSHNSHEKQYAAGLGRDLHPTIDNHRRTNPLTILKKT